MGHMEKVNVVSDYVLNELVVTIEKMYPYKGNQTPVDCTDILRIAQVNIMSQYHNDINTTKLCSIKLFTRHIRYD